MTKVGVATGDRGGEGCGGDGVEGRWGGCQGMFPEALTLISGVLKGKVSPRPGKEEGNFRWRV